MHDARVQPAVAARGVMRDDDGTGGDGEGAQAKELLVRVGKMREREMRIQVAETDGDAMWMWRWWRGTVQFLGVEDEHSRCGIGLGRRWWTLFR